MNELLDSPKTGSGLPQVVPNFSYGAFGEGVEKNWGSLFLFTARSGGLSSESGGVLNWHRWYSSVTSKWLSRDPLGIDGEFNLYAYVSNSPINEFDETGLKVQLCCRDVQAQNVASNMVANLAGKKHCFIKTDTTTAGMGPTGNGEPSSPIGSDTVIRDHKGQERAATCQDIPDVDEDCVNSWLGARRATGKWVPLSNDCNTTAKGILSRCKKGKANHCNCKGGING